MELYNKLLEQFQKLTEEEKNAILIYKSRLFSIINSVTKIDNYRELSDEEIYYKLENKSKLENILDEFNSILSLPENMFIKFGVFGSVNLTSLNRFIASVKNIDKLIESAISKIELDEDVIVYRGIVSNNTDINFSDSSSIISTSVKFDDACKFLNTEGGNNKHIFIMNLKCGVNVLPCPYNIIRTYKDSENIAVNRLNGIEPTYLKIVKNTDYGQEEIMLYNSKCDFNEIDNKMIGEDKDIYCHFVDVNKKIKDINYDL